MSNVLEGKIPMSKSKLRILVIIANKKEKGKSSKRILQR